MVCGTQVPGTLPTATRTVISENRFRQDARHYSISSSRCFSCSALRSRTRMISTVSRSRSSSNSASSSDSVALISAQSCLTCGRKTAAARSASFDALLPKSDFAVILSWLIRLILRRGLSNLLCVNKSTRRAPSRTEGILLIVQLQASFLPPLGRRIRNGSEISNTLESTTQVACVASSHICSALARSSGVNFAMISSSSAASRTFSSFTPNTEKRPHHAPSSVNPARSRRTETGSHSLNPTLSRCAENVFRKGL